MSGSRSKYNRDRGRASEPLPEEEYSSFESDPLEGIGQFFNAIIKVAVLALFCFVIYFGVKRAYSFGYSIFTTETAQAPPGTDAEITILEGMSDRNVGIYLQQQGLIPDSSIFTVQCLIYGYEIKPGTYTLNSSQTIYEMLCILAAGPS